MADGGAVTLDISAAGANGTVRVVFAGELDSVTVGRLSDAIERALRVHQAGEVVIDLANVTFLGCAAAVALLTGAATARSRGIGFRVVNARSGARRLLTLAAALPGSSAPYVL